MLEGTKGKIACGGAKDESSLYIAPTLVTDITRGDVLLQVF